MKLIAARAARLALGLATMACAVSAAPVSPPAHTVRALFVGIDTYKYNDPTKKFENLKGPVNDVRLLRDTLAQNGLLPGEIFAAGDPVCTEGKVSITLVNDCATRDGVIKAWAKLVDASHEGDTLLFYFAGHGSRLDDPSQTHAGEKAGTLVPYDARGPDGVSDILAVENRVMTQTAIGRGVNVVTIFDSCHSASAARAIRRDEIRGRAAPAQDLGLADHPLTNLTLKTRPPQAASMGYLVNIAAAANDETDRGTAAEGPAPETGHGVVVHGRFTLALTQAITNSYGAAHHQTYADLLEQARSALATRNALQVPHIEGGGEAQLFLGDARVIGHEYPAHVENGRVTLDAGDLLRVTVGSTFALFASSSAAADGPPLATGTVTAQGFSQFASSLATDKPVTGKRSLWARELAHQYTADDRVKLIMVGGTKADLDDLRPKLANMDMVAEVSDANAADFKLDLTGTAPVISLAVASKAWPLAIDVDKLQVASANRNDKIVEALRRLASYNAMLRLKDRGGDADLGGLTILAQCRDQVGDDTGCPALGNSTNPGMIGAMRDSGIKLAPADPAAATPGVAAVPAGQKFEVKLWNVSAQPLHPYLFILWSDYSITLAYPPANADDLLAPAGSVIAGWGVAKTPPDARPVGINTLVLIMTDKDHPIAAGALAQSGLPARGVDCTAGLARLLCAARTGARGAIGESPGKWGVANLGLTIQPAKP